jgi:periplasmic mercuric ion binding protein
MRQLLLAAVVVVVVTVGAAQARADEKAVIAGPHICCGNCVKAVGAILAKVDGISAVKCSAKEKTVTFMAKDNAATQKALEAMVAGGFAGTAKFGDATLTQATSKLEGKANEVVVKGVHACCGQCHKAIKGLFPDAKVTFAGTGPQRDVTIVGTDLSLAAVQQALNDKGFSGKVEKK